MNTLTIKLKQHTPLIHFQHDQDGATLRASEVKPKLDKYIIKHEFHDNFDECKTYLVGYNPKKLKELKSKWDSGFRALDYKIKIDSPKRVIELSRSNGYKINPKTKEPLLDKSGQKILKYESIPLFLGNMKDKAPKKMTIADEDITINFFSLHSELLNYINDNLELFFFMNNFGTRQSKGFGSFYLANEKLPEIKGAGSYYSFIINTKKTKGEWKDYQILFQYIDLFYKTLRSGINQNGCYFKSLMYHYAKSKERNEYWDKRAIRTHFELFSNSEQRRELTGKYLGKKREWDKGETNDFLVDSNTGVDSFPNSKTRLYRDMLGLSSTQSWMFYGATISKEENADKKEIERFKSPILLKPLYDENTQEYIVYIIPMPICDGIKDKEFKITIKYSEGRQANRNITPMPIKTPSVFDVADYLKYVFEGEGKNIVETQIKAMPDEFDKFGKKKTETIKEKLKRIYNIL